MPKTYEIKMTGYTSTMYEQTCTFETNDKIVANNSGEAIIAAIESAELKCEEMEEELHIKSILCQELG